MIHSSKLLLTILLWTFGCISSFSQTRIYSDEKIFKIDSLSEIINSNVDDSIKVDALVTYDNLVMRSDGFLSLKINQQIDSISTIHLGNFNGTERDLYFLKKLNYAYAGYAVLYEDFGDFKKAIKYIIRMIKIAKFRNDNKSLARAYNHMGNLYEEINDREKSLEYYQKCLDASLITNDTIGLFMSYGNIANIYKAEGDYEKARNFYQKGLVLELLIDHKYGISITYNQLGLLHLKNGELDSAQYYFDQCYNLKLEMESHIGAATTLISLARISAIKNDFRKSISQANEALQLAQNYNSIHTESNAAMRLQISYEAIGDFEKSLFYLKLHHELMDSLLSFENQNDVIKQGYSFEYQSKKLADSLAFVNDQKISELNYLQKLDKEKLQQYYLYIGLGITLLFGGFAYNRFKQTRKQKQVIESQKSSVDRAFEELGEKNKEIMDSIAYAKRIQSAILPPDKLVKELLPESFVLYKPKDVVAGDFYWLEKVENNILFAAADCTGHGVPGAMVSVICNGALNRSVREFGLTDPAKILDKAREIVIQEFEKSEEEVKDGMDIALCGINDLTLTYAGANNPLWIVRNNEIIETKADKQPIGKFSAAKAFTSHSIELEKGDTIYIFSDGYVDQFGGDKGKKLKAKALRELLLSIQDCTLKEQKSILDQSFESWRGQLEQIDDVCVIGVRLPALSPVEV